MINPYYSTDYGKAYLVKVESFLNSALGKSLKGKIDLIFFSPPFFLNRKKKYGNLEGSEYIEWFSNLGRDLSELLSERGSIVAEMGNGWISGEPCMSTEPIEALLGFKRAGELKLCQQFIWYNTAKLPSPAHWVNVKRIRVKDSFTHIWWMSKNENPKASNRNVLVEYSESMKKLIKTKKYNSGNRPSEHSIGKKSFAKNNKGAIPSNVIVAANTKSSSPYLKYCKANNLSIHPARMPSEIPEFFVKFLTDKGDLVYDPFGGSNTTGMVAEKLSRKWMITEANRDYLEGSIGRFKTIQAEASERKI